MRLFTKETPHGCFQCTEMAEIECHTASHVRKGYSPNFQDRLVQTLPHPSSLATFCNCWLASFFPGYSLHICFLHGCNTEVATPPQPLHKHGQHGGGRPLRKHLTLIYCIFISMPPTCPRFAKQSLITYSCLFMCFDVGSGSSVDHPSGMVGGVLASFTTMVKEC